MEPWLQTIITVFCSVMASSGFWVWMQAKRDKKDAKTRIILGLGHDRIMFLSMKYLERGWITADEYEDLNKYLYTPYRELGGNGTAEKLMTEVRKLPVRHISYVEQAKNDQEPEIGPSPVNPHNVGKPDWY